MKEKEILAPAGSEAAFVAAVENGADAVYMGGKAFNARSYADNFEPGDIRRLCRYAHLLGVKVFLTLNILILPQEVERALDYARKLALAGVDALIVQDIGLAAALGKIVGPEVEIHASTQMTLMNSWGLDFAAALGCSRVVLAREVSAANIRRMKEKSPLLLEIFGHGALCSGWSGQCLFSSLLGGRSGNRGQCAQPCRLKYQLTDGEGRSLTDTGSQGAYLLSTKDLCTVEFLDQLLEAGAGSFKLEGRMKQPEYVAMVTRQYREAMEEAGGALVPGEEKSGDQKGGLEEAKKKNLQRRLAVLSRCFNRGFTSGYYLRLPGSHLMSRQKPNNQSQIDESLRQSARESFRVPGCRRRRAIGGKLWVRTGEPLRLDLWAWPVGTNQEPDKTKDRIIVEVFSPEPCQAAKGEGARRESLAAQLDRFGSTLFRLTELEIDTDGKAFVPASLLNQLRRKAAARLEEAILAPWEREEAFSCSMAAAQEKLMMDLGQKKTERMPQETAFPELTIAVDTAAGLRAALEAGIKEIYLGGQGFRGRHSLWEAADVAAAVRACHEAGARLWWSLPRFIHEEKTDFWQERAAAALLAGADGLLIANPGGLQLARRLNVPVLAADWPLNLYNDLSLALLQEYGVSRACLSPELTLEQMKTLGLAGLEKEAFIHGRLPLIVTEHCLPGTILGQKQEGDCAACSRPCLQENWYLKDRLNFRFPLYPDNDCRNWLYNAKTHCMLEHLDALQKAGIRRLRIEACQEKPEWIRATGAAYQQGLAALTRGEYSRKLGRELKKGLEKLTPHGFTAGHFFRGVE